MDIRPAEAARESNALDVLARAYCIAIRNGQHAVADDIFQCSKACGMLFDDFTREVHIQFKQTGYSEGPVPAAPGARY